MTSRGRAAPASRACAPRSPSRPPPHRGGAPLDFRRRCATALRHKLCALRLLETANVGGMCKVVGIQTAIMRRDAVGLGNMMPFWATYKAHREAYDEMFDRQGNPQPGYSRVLTEFLATHADKFDEIRDRADRMFL